MWNIIIQYAEKLGSKIASLNFDFWQAKFIYYQIKPLRENENGIAYWMGFISNFTNINLQIQFFVIGNSKNIILYAKVPEILKNYFENTFYSSFPNSDLDELTNDNILSSHKMQLIQDLDLGGQNYNLKFVHGEFFTDAEFKKDGVYLDPFKDVLSLYNTVHPQDYVGIYFNYIFKIKETILWRIIKKIFQLFQKLTDTGEIKTTGEVKEIPLALVSINFKLKLHNQSITNDLKKNITDLFYKFIKSDKIETSYFIKYYIINYLQLINFFHLITKENFIKNLEYLNYRKLPYPSNIPIIENSAKNEVTIFGMTDYKSDHMKFGIKCEDKFRHIYILGKTGTGKSTLISNMIRSDMITNNGIAVVDPHGELIEIILEYIPTWRTNDVIVFDVSDSKFPISFNIFEWRNEEEKNLVCSGIVSIFKKLYGEISWGPRLEYILRNVVFSVIEYPNATLLHLTRMLTDKNFREEILGYVKDPIVIKFWRQEFDKRNDKFRDEAISPIVNKVGQFLSSPILRNIFGQPKSNLNFRKIMDEGKILLINLSKGKIGEDNTKMIGSFFVTKFQIDAMSRADVSESKRRPFYLYIDEFQNFATDSFRDILSEARKYKLSLIMANQFISQIEENIRNAIFGNVGSIISFTLGYDDAVIMSSQFKGLITPNDLLSIPKYKAYIKLMIDGVVCDPFNMKTFALPSSEIGEEIKEKIRKQSRQRYAVEKDKLESLIKIWADKTFSPVEKVMEKAKAMSTEKNITPSSEFTVVKDKYQIFFEKFKIENSMPDAILYDNIVGDHKAIWYAKPLNFDNYTKIDNQKIKNQIYYKDEKFIYNVKVDMYEHNTIKSGDKSLLDIWVGTKEEVKNQIQNGFTKADKWKLIENSFKNSNNVTALPPPVGDFFNISHIVLGEWYEGLVKLKYNYGLFVTVKGVEGLLHKNLITLPAPEIRRKDLYNIGDNIKVKALEFKDVDNVKRVVWTQINN